MSIFSLFLFAFWFLVAFITPCLAETNKLFQWAFKDTSISSELPTCTAFSIVVKSFDPTTNATQGTPPYYMISFPVGGTPVTTFIGTDENNLSWTVTQPINSQLLLSVVDANGSAGGIPPQFLTVIPGQTTQCITTPLDTPAFTVSSNVTGSLETCAPWGVTVKGGSPPYVITLAQINSPVVTNVTMPFGTDRFTFINRADPGEQLIAGISDLQGRWASGTPVVNPTGSADVDCVGLVSSSGNSTLINEQDAALNAAAAAAKRKRSLVTGLTVTVLLLLLLALGGAALWHLRRRRRQNQETMETTRARQFVGIETGFGSGLSGGQTGLVEKGSVARRDSEAPPYQEVEEVAGPSTAGATAGAAPLTSFPLRGSFKRPQLPKLETSALRLVTASDSALPPTSQRSSDSATALISYPGFVAKSSPSQLVESSNPSKPPPPSRGASVSSLPGFSKFPVTSIRKKSLGAGALNDISALPAPALSPYGKGGQMSRNASANASNPNDRGYGNPFGDKAALHEERGQGEDEGPVAQFSEGGGQEQLSGLPPRYRSLRGMGGAGYGRR